MRAITHLLILSQIYSSSAKQPPIVSQRRTISTGAGHSSILPLQCTDNKNGSYRRTALSAAAIPRGGGDIEESDAELSDDDEDDDEILPESTAIARPSSSSSLLSKIYPYYLSMVIRMKRGFVAGWDAARDKSHSNNDAAEDNLPKLHSFLGKTGYVFQRVYRGVVSSEDADDGDAMATVVTTRQDVGLEQSTVERSRRAKTRKRRRRRRHGQRRRSTKRISTGPTSIANGGGQQSKDISTAIQSLANKYNVDETNENHHTSILTSTQISFHDALQKSNADARFLICYISQSASDNQRVIPTLLHPQFTKLIQRKPLGKKNLQDTGSYYLWILCDDASPSTSATTMEVVKRLKLKNQHSKNKSILTVVHPASAVDTASGKLKVVPKVLARHHCNPPPSTVDAVSSWITALRKRHLREYAKLQFDRKERYLHRERNMGYQQSVAEDVIREKRAAAELLRKQKEEEAEARRLEEMRQRRLVLLENLPEEPQDGEVITIALRFQNVSSGDSEASTQRKFRKEESMNTVFNWMDAVHGLEREKISLSTMNGSKRFVYVDESVAEDDDNDEEVGERSLSLEEAGLGKMTALRVSEIATDEATEVNEES